MATRRNSITLRYYGHACLGLFAGNQPLLVIDPFDRRAFPEHTTLNGPPDIFPLAIATHGHADHCAFARVPSARVIDAMPERSYRSEELQIYARHAAHDEFGGRLRGGLTSMLDLRIKGLRIVHCGDLGERLCGPALEWLLMPRCDALILPAGGYFTLGADGALELAGAAAPRHAVFVHCADQGVALPQMQSSAQLRARAGDRLVERDELVLRAEPRSGAEAPAFAPPELSLLAPQR